MASSAAHLHIGRQQFQNLRSNDRRRHERIGLRCTVALWKPTDGIVAWTTTENISSEGFYCVCDEPYVPGDELEASLEVPSWYWNNLGSGSLILQCRLVVVRTVCAGVDPTYGVAFRIQDYVAIVAR